jgi:hypothetical protein
MLKVKESEYEKQARDFAEKHNLTMHATYRGHYPRFGNNITANYTITLSRPGKRPYIFTFSTSINDSWYYTDEGHMSKKHKGLPLRLDIDKFMLEYLNQPQFAFGRYIINQTKTAPSLYSVLTCLTKQDPGSFEDFCADYGYDTDSRAAEKIWYDAREEGRAVEALFSDCLEELEEIQ